MNNSIYNNINGEIAVLRFSSLIPSDGKAGDVEHMPEFMVTGPFVCFTDGGFETEHMYEREKILAVDYLASDGGEKNVVPYIGKSVVNDYYGPAHYTWTRGRMKWDALRFDAEEAACDDVLYATEQRNAVYYAAVYVECEKEENAVICYDGSGSLLYINGELIDSQPYGRVKGLWNTGFQRAVHFNKGRNLVLFKVRPGYIADSMDICISNCIIYPLICATSEIGIAYPAATLCYTGTKAEPRQIFPVFAGVLSDTDGGELKYSAAGYSQTLSIPALKKGECFTLRASVPAANKESTVRAEFSLASGGENAGGVYFFDVVPCDGFDGTEHIMSDFHFDTTYHQEQRTYALGAFYITKCIAERLAGNPDFKATLSEVDYLHPFCSLYPEHREIIKKAFSDGRAEADCFYNQANDLTSSGEGFVRNLIYGQLYHRDVLGRICYVYAPGDVFGHHNQMTQLCLKGGCTGIKWGKHMMGVDRLFHHVSPDGSTLLHNKGFGRADALRLNMPGCDGSGARGRLEPYPRDNDTSWMKNTVSHVKFSVFSEQMNDIILGDKKNTADNGISSVDYTSRDLTQHHSGVLLTRTDFKQANRLCENLLISAEKFSAIAFMYGAGYPEKALDKAWRQLLCAQHHDSVTGTNNEISFVDLMIQYREAAELAADILNRAAEFISSGVDTSDISQPLFVFNPHAFERGDRCVFQLPESCDLNKHYILTDEKGREYPVINEKTGCDGRITACFVPDKIPAMGYAVYALSETCDVQPVQTTESCTIENSRFRLSVSKALGGGITSVYDKKNKREVLDVSSDGPANRVVVLRELHDRMETQHELYTTGHKMYSSDFEAESIECIKTPVYQRLKIIVKLDIVARVFQEITLYKNSDVIDMKTSVEDYTGTDDLFTLTFPLNIKGGKVIYDDRFAPHVSVGSKKKLSFQTHQYASFSGCRVLPSNQWFGIGPTLTVKLGDSTRFNAGMTVIIRRNDKELIKCCDRLLFALTEKAVPVTPYPDTEQHGGAKIIHFNEDIYSTDTRFVLCVRGDKNVYADKLLATLKKPLTEKFNRLLDKNGSAAVYFKDNDNAYKKDVDVILLCAENCDYLGQLIDKITASMRVSSEMLIDGCILAGEPGFSDDYGASLINNGTISASVEGGNMLNMMLFHTASFYGNAGRVTGSAEMVPEHKTHVFTYAFYPHAGNHIDAEVYKKAFEFNDPLFAVNAGECANHESCLPKSRSFLKVSDGFMLTSFKAGGYPMASLRGKKQSFAERGFSLRGFECNGTAHKVNMKFGFNVLGAQSVNLLEENPSPVKTGMDSMSVSADAYEVQTYLLSAMPGKTIGSAQIGALTERCEPVFIRSWEHDMGALPMGYFSFAVAISRKPYVLSDTETVLTVTAADNMTDSHVSGILSLSCSEGLSLSRTQIPYTLKSGEMISEKVTVTKASPDASGNVRLNYSFDGQEFTDVYEFGLFNPEITMEINGGKIVCTVSNPTAQSLSGELYISSPFETWKLSQFNQCASGQIAPSCMKVDLCPGETEKYVFNVSFEDTGIINSYWAAAKLAVNGRIHFAYAHTDNERHNYWAHEFIHEIENDNGSIKKLLDM